MRVELLGHGEITDDLLTSEERADEFLLMGLRLAEGIDPARYQALAGRPLDPDRIAMLTAQASSKAAATAACASRRPASRCSTPWWPIWRPDALAADGQNRYASFDQGSDPCLHDRSGLLLSLR